MRKLSVIYIILSAHFVLLCIAGYSQEHTGPLGAAPNRYNRSTPVRQVAKTTASSLPFFEDFTGYSMLPDATKWMDCQVYINNTMAVSPITRGVATFDGLNERGLPWDPFHNTVFSYADSLTCQPIDLSAYTAADSLYLSFFYQPEGNGFYPLPGDSLMLFMRIRYGEWLPVWKVPGSTLKPFTQVMIPVTDSLYFHNAFQFRFVNIAALNFADAIWNVDYIRMAANRNINDTEVNDIGFSSNPSFFLNDYTSMPYRQFYANPTGERATQYVDSIRNNTTAQPVTYAFAARDLGTGTVLQPLITNTVTLPGNVIQYLNFNNYTTTVSPPGTYDKVVFENSFYIESTTGTGPAGNDTIVKQQVFDNYLAYDDGTAEQSYYLTLFPTLPGKIAVEYHLNTPDTMKGMAIYFGRQVPASDYKSFDIVIYSAIAGVNGASADNVLYTQYSCNPGYADTQNNFWIYKFDTPLPLPSGTFYAGVFMPAESGADSIYFGLDVNRIGGNHVYYNVLSAWNPSLVQGALMVRPLLGQNIVSSYISNAYTNKSRNVEITPNPATDAINITCPGDEKATYSVNNMQGQAVQTGHIVSGNKVDISMLPKGIYLINITVNGINSVPQKIVKL
ncbi:MAG: T9SS type A sorting domain-containing protein [Taibaiella sp.]|nr:T9SS type A sorting domain-containing protein [Taibaiella sp.]